MTNGLEILRAAFAGGRWIQIAPYLCVMLGTAGSLLYNIRVSLLNKYSIDYIARAMLRNWFELGWMFLVTNLVAMVCAELLASSKISSTRAMVGFLFGVVCGSGAGILERNMWNFKFISSFVLRPTSELSFAVLTRLDRAASAFERADNDAWQCQSGYWNLGIEPMVARNRMRLIFEGSKEHLVTRWGRSEIYVMDARWHPGNYFFLLVRFYGRRRLRKLMRHPPAFRGLRKEWNGEATRRIAGQPENRADGYLKGDKVRRYDHLG